MMHANTDSDVTSDQSPPRSPSPKQPVYFVQSPSRDSSLDGDNKSSSAVANSPGESPSHHSVGRHSRESSESRVSGSYSSWGWKKGNNRKRGSPEFKVIEEEEGEYGDFYRRRSEGLARKTQFFVAVVGFVVIFSLFCLIIWGASRPYKPQISVKSLAVHNFYYGEGSDTTGVPTKMLTMNSLMKMTVYNPATFFGIHVSAKSVKLMYSEITVAAGEVKKYYQQRKSHRTLFVKLQGSKVPLYGAGASLADSADNGRVAMKLGFEVKSKGNIVGKLVRSKHSQQVSCSIAVDSRSNKPIILKGNSCTYA